MIETRPADSNDVTALAELGSSSFWDAYRGTASDEDIAIHVANYFSAEVIFREMALPGVNYVVAHEDGSLSGFAKIRSGDPHPCLDAVAAIEVQQLYISPDFQRRGVGGILIERSAELAREQGVDGLWLSVWSGADWALSFYKKCGFARKGTADFHLASEVHLDYVMWLAVGNS